MSDRYKRKLERIFEQRELFNNSSKDELWNNMKACNRGFMTSCYLAGCFLSLLFFSPRIFPFSTNASAFELIGKFFLMCFLTALPGLVFGVFIFTFLFLVFFHTSSESSIPRVVLTILIVPAVALLLVFSLNFF